MVYVYSKTYVSTKSQDITIESPPEFDFTHEKNRWMYQHEVRIRYLTSSIETANAHIELKTVPTQYRFLTTALISAASHRFYRTHAMTYDL
jgi:hypothetical protein